MSTPLATPSELGVYLGTTINLTDPRGLLMLQLAHDLCESVVSPVPVLAKGVELSVAARAFTNVSSAYQMGLGSASVAFGSRGMTYGVGGLYLSRTDKATLRRLAGRSGAFNIDLLPNPAATMAPVLSEIDPDGATTGDLVRITGSGFTASTTLTFGGVAAEFFVVSDELVHAVIPAGSAGFVSVVMTNPIGASLPLTYERG